LATALPVAFLVVACSGGAQKAEQAESAPEKKKEYVVLADFVSEADSLAHLRFRESGLVSVNDRCAVRLVRLNPRMSPVWVNGRPVGFC
jgi:hypothetical protein